MSNKKIVFSNNLKEHRIRRNLTQQQLADRVGLTHQAISNYENDIRNIDLDILVSLAKILAVTIDDLITKEVEE